MAVFRVQKTQNYTIMSNHHLRNKALSLKAKGLLSLMLSLPEDWDYTTRGLASICKPTPRPAIALPTWSRIGMGLTPPLSTLTAWLPCTAIWAKNSSGAFCRM